MFSQVSWGWGEKRGSDNDLAAFLYFFGSKLRLQGHSYSLLCSHRSHCLEVMVWQCFEGAFFALKVVELQFWEDGLGLSVCNFCVSLSLSLSLSLSALIPFPVLCKCTWCRHLFLGSLGFFRVGALKTRKHATLSITLENKGFQANIRALTTLDNMGSLSKHAWTGKTRKHGTFCSLHWNHWKARDYLSLMTTHRNPVSKRESHRKADACPGVAEKNPWNL